jgi:hypothetical protein
MSFAASWHLAGLASIDTLSLRGQTPVTSYLLVVAKAVSFGNLLLFTPIHLALVAPLPIFTFRRKTPMPADLLIVARTITGGTRLAVAILSLTDRTPLCLDYLAAIFHNIDLCSSGCHFLPNF